MHNAIRVGDRVMVLHQSSMFVGQKGTVTGVNRSSLTNSLVCKIDLDIGKTWSLYDYKLRRLKTCVMETK